MGKVVVTIGRDGKSRIEAFDFVGASCAKATEPIRRALGGDQEETRKPEFYEGTELQQNEGA